jgi:hypothetical protein
MSIQSDKVISDISEAMSKSIRKLFPEDIGHEEMKKATLTSVVETQIYFQTGGQVLQKRLFAIHRWTGADEYCRR